MSESTSDDDPVRPSKRQRHRHVVSSESINDPHSNTSTVNESPKANKENEDPETPKPKRPKYRIHVPTNPDMPEDTFLTQPPSRSPSPYRIDKFCWQKPGRPTAPSSDSQHWQVAPASRRSASEDAARQLPVLHNLPNPGEQTLQIHERTTDSTNPVLLASAPATLDGNYNDVLDDLPSDAFSSPEPTARANWNQPIDISSQDMDSQLGPSQVQRPARLAAPFANLRQTTLFGDQAPESNTQTQSVRKRNWPLANKEEPPTHHAIDRQAMETWVYPTNLGITRDYQYSIVRGGLYHNMLVALPTGLGKTFIAATIMLNWFRWTTNAQIVFVAPTKPLVAQQIKACFGIAGIPRHMTTMLTGNTPPGIRAEEWLTKRVFFMTPQTIVNDLKTGICDPKRLVLLVVDEAHRATGGYAYVEVVQFLRRFNTSFRVLALTATPGSSIESVQEVIDGLGISRIEIRTEESLDIREYVHSRKVETILFEPNHEMVMIMGLFSKALQPLVDKLCGMNAYWGKDPMTLTAYGCTQARSKWMSTDAGRKANFGIKGMVNQIFSLLASLAHGIELLKFHGIGPFYHKVLAFRDEIDDAGGKVSKYRQQINESEAFRTMMSRVQIWINNPDFVGHPKLEYLQSVVLNHFLDAGEGRGASAPSGTRIMVFAHYRDSAEEIARVLKRNEPMVRPRVFVGQANSKGSEGMDQKTQLDVIQKFQSGIFNTLVATSIGEEGLDIGEVDLIVCYDASASPIRMLQRMGRTGRKRAGNIVVTLMKGKEENNFIKAKDNYEKMQQEIASGVRFNFRDDHSHRIVPREIQPVVDKKMVDIPVENTQADLPEPSRKGRAPKRPPKKFHMPNGVRTGFVKASRVGGESTSDGSDTASKQRARVEPAEPLPSLAGVLLNPVEQRELERRYLDVQGDDPRFVEFPRVDAFPELQREHRPTKHVPHGRFTNRIIQTLKVMKRLETGSNVNDLHESRLHPDDRREILLQVQQRARISGHSGGSPSDLYFSTGLVEKAVAMPHSDHRLEDSLPSLLDSSKEKTSDLVEKAANRNGQGSQVASLRSQSPPSTLDNVFYRPTRTASRAASASEEDLPDCSTLIQKQVKASSGLLPGGKNVRAAPVSKARKRRKVIMDDDDDDDGSDE
ncbi:MAG: hypothetical protein L6R42_003556 [Xanthoria sp. 1 TBL-2021]|nr:MAG: hypothetical protein L6R42_003556 [Xanthoria sp. 1 TBL-2021]